jgi:hypothetical protein
MEDPLISFNQQSSSSVTTPTKQKTCDLYENRSLEDVEPFGNHNGNGTNGQEYHSNNGTNKDDHHNGTNGKKDDQFTINNDLFPVDTNENEKGKLIFEKKLNKYLSLFFSVVS